MFECQVSLLSVACIFKPAQLLIAFQQQVTDITIRLRKNDGLENYLLKKKIHIREILSHSRESRSRASFPEAPEWSGRVHVNYVIDMIAFNCGVISFIFINIKTHTKFWAIIII